MDLELRGKTVIVTGASKGIGLSAATCFAKEGAVVKLIARTEAQLVEASNFLRGTYQADVDHLAIDIASSGAVEAIARAYPDADILVNNAGGIPAGDLLAVDEPRWRAAWELKVFGYINMSRAYYRIMCARGAGVILNVIGFSAEKLDPRYVAGCTGNAALAAFTRAVGGGSLEHGVRVLGVHPGWVETERALTLLRNAATERSGDPERWRELIRDWPGGKLIQPGEIAELIVFLTSARARAVSGQVFTADAGLGSRSVGFSGF